jgi:hypothetical protein
MVTAGEKNFSQPAFLVKHRHSEGCRLEINKDSCIVVVS